jgi:hypothetical protein
MTTKLSVTVTVDMDAATATLRPAGRLTFENVHGILAVLRRAGHVLPGFDILLDLDKLRIGSPEALRALSGPSAEILHGHHSANAHDGYRPSPGLRAAA